MSLWWLGAIFSLLGSVLSNFGVNMQKFAFMREQTKPVEDRVAYTRNPRWWLGLSMVILGAIGDFAALALTAQSIVAPIGSVTLVANLFFATLWLGEVLCRQQVIGTVLIVIGSTLTVAFGDHSSQEYVIDDLIDFMKQLGFLAYAIVVGSLVVLLVYFIRVVEPKRVAWERLRQFDMLQDKEDMTQSGVLVKGISFTEDEDEEDGGAEGANRPHMSEAARIEAEWGPAAVSEQPRSLPADLGMDTPANAAHKRKLSPSSRAEQGVGSVPQSPDDHKRQRAQSAYRQGSRHHARRRSGTRPLGRKRTRKKSVSQRLHNLFAASHVWFSTYAPPQQLVAPARGPSRRRHLSVMHAGAGSRAGRTRNGARRSASVIVRGGDGDVKQFSPETKRAARLSSGDESKGFNRHASLGDDVLRPAKHRLGHNKSKSEPQNVLKMVPGHLPEVLPFSESSRADQMSPSHSQHSTATVPDNTTLQPPGGHTKTERHSWHMGNGAGEVSQSYTSIASDSDMALDRQQRTHDHTPRHAPASARQHSPPDQMMQALNVADLPLSRVMTPAGLSSRTGPPGSDPTTSSGRLASLAPTGAHHSAQRSVDMLPGVCETEGNGEGANAGRSVLFTLDDEEFNNIGSPPGPPPSPPIPGDVDVGVNGGGGGGGGGVSYNEEGATLNIEQAISTGTDIFGNDDDIASDGVSNNNDNNSNTNNTNNNNNNNNNDNNNDNDNVSDLNVDSAGNTDSFVLQTPSAINVEPQSLTPPVQSSPNPGLLTQSLLVGGRGSSTSPQPTKFGGIPSFHIASNPSSHSTVPVDSDPFLTGPAVGSDPFVTAPSAASTVTVDTHSLDRDPFIPPARLSEKAFAPKDIPLMPRPTAEAASADTDVAGVEAVVVDFDQDGSNGVRRPDGRLSVTSCSEGEDDEVCWVPDEAYRRSAGSYEKWRSVLPFCYCATSGIIGAQSILSGKMVSMLLSATFQGDVQMDHFLFYVFLGMLLLTIFVQLHYLAQALERFGALYVVPVFQCFFISTSAIGGAALFQEFASFNSLQAGMFPTGMLITIAGVWILAKASNPDGVDTAQDFRAGTDDSDGGDSVEKPAVEEAESEEEVEVVVMS